MTEDVESKIAQGIIYKLQGDDGSFYIGSTSRTLEARLSNHKYNVGRHSCPAARHFEGIGWDHVTASILETHMNVTKVELLEHENRIIQSLVKDEFCLNQLSAKVDKEARRKYNREYLQRQREEHPEKFKEYQRSYNERHPERKLLQGRKSYEKRKEYRTERIPCLGCGVIIRRDGMSKHVKNELAYCEARIAELSALL